MKSENCLKNLAARLFAGTLTCCCLASAVSAAVIVNDTWCDGTDTDPAAPNYSEFGVDSDADGDIESAWFGSVNSDVETLNPVGPGGPLVGTVGTSSSSWTTYFTAEDCEIELANVGDSLKVTWAFSLAGSGTQNSSQNFRVALVDTPGADRLSADGNPGSASYTGYGMFMNMGSTLGRSTPFRIMERADASGALLSSSGEWATVADSAPPTVVGAPGYVDSTPYTFEMTITRTGGNLLDIASVMTGGNLDGTGIISASANGQTPNNGSFKFDTFSLRPSNAVTTASTFSTTLFKVEGPVKIPEPASLALLGLSALAMVSRRQRVSSTGRERRDESGRCFFARGTALYLPLWKMSDAG